METKTETSQIKSGKGNHKNHHKNQAYEGLDEEAKKKAITKAYYERKGRLYYAKKNRSKKFNIDEVLFKECKTIEEMDIIVKDQLIESGINADLVNQLIITRTNKGATPLKPH